jgi:hypothetical protein
MKQHIQSGISPLLAILLPLALTVGCVGGMGGPQVVGSGTAKTESRDVGGNFTHVGSSGSADMSVTVGGDKTAVTVTADDNILPMIETIRDGDELKIICHGNFSPKTRIHVDITTPSLSAVSISGSGNADITGVAGPSFKASISGSGNVKATGQVDQLAAHISGSGDMDFRNVTAKSAEVSVSGSGNVTVNATQDVSASVSGSGDIRYAGNPSKVNSHVSGSGSVKKI